MSPGRPTQARPPLLTIGDVAGELAVHQKTVVRYIREGRLRGVRLGRGYRIRREDLDAFLEARTTTTGPLPAVEATA